MVSIHPTHHTAPDGHWAERGSFKRKCTVEKTQTNAKNIHKWAAYHPKGQWAEKGAKKFKFKVPW